MRLTSSTWSGRIFLLLIACVCLGTLGYPGAGLAREEYTSDTRGGEGDPGDGVEYAGGSGIFSDGISKKDFERDVDVENRFVQITPVLNPSPFFPNIIWIKFIPTIFFKIGGQE